MISGRKGTNEMDSSITFSFSLETLSRPQSRKAELKENPEIRVRIQRPVLEGH